MQKVIKKRVKVIIHKVVEVKKYYCDYCGDEVGNDNHLSIELGKHCGWVKPPEWKHEFELEKRPYQFCNHRCLHNFLETGKKKHGR